VSEDIKELYPCEEFVITIDGIRVINMWYATEYCLFVLRKEKSRVDYLDMQDVIKKLGFPRHHCYLHSIDPLPTLITKIHYLREDLTRVSVELLLKEMIESDELIFLNHIIQEAQA
jgi:hypothetical protein